MKNPFRLLSRPAETIKIEHAEPPRLLADLEEKIRALRPGQVIGHRIQDKTDWTGKGDLTIVVYCGQMEPRRFQDIQDIFSGKKTGHFRPRQGVEG